MASGSISHRAQHCLINFIRHTENVFISVPANLCLTEEVLYGEFAIERFTNYFEKLLRYPLTSQFAILPFPRTERSYYRYLQHIKKLVICFI